MKKIFAVLAFGAFGFAAKAQTTFNAGLELAVPSADLGTWYSFGIGASAKALFPMGGDKNALTGSVGYISFMGKDVNGYKAPSVGVIPIKVGYKLGFDGGFYVEPQIGYSIWSGSGSSQSGFTYAPNVGYATGNLDFSVRYEATSISSNGVSATNGFIGLRAAYSFGGK